MTTTTGTGPADRRQRAEASAEPLWTVPLPWAIALPAAPVGFVVLAYVAIYTATAGDDPGLPAQFPNLLLGVGGIGAVLLLWRRWDEAVWRASVRYAKPTAADVVAGLLVAAGGVGIAIGLNVLADAVGLAPHEKGTVETNLGLVSLLFGSVIVAPIAEEVLFRGLLLGRLLAGSAGVVGAVVLSVLWFALTHVFMAGLVSVVVAAVLGLLLTALRLWFDDLVAAWLAHFLINCWGFLVAIGVSPTPW